MAHGPLVSFATLHITHADIKFCDSPGMLTSKTVLQVYSSTSIVECGFIDSGLIGVSILFQIKLYSAQCVWKILN